MRLFQFHSFYRPYLSHFYTKYPTAASAPFSRHLAIILEDRFHSVHVLDPVYTSPKTAAFTVANDPTLQLKWAEERGLKTRSLEEILIAQIEEHRAEVVYSLDPVRFGSEFIARLPGCVRRTVCWFAAPGSAPGAAAYDLRVCNFRNFLDSWTRQGLRAEWFFPAVDPCMEEYARKPYSSRRIDVAFAGLYSRHHSVRNDLLVRLAVKLRRHQLAFAFQAPKWKPLGEARFLNRIPTFIPYLPKDLRQVSIPPVYGVDLYNLFGSAKLVVNVAVDVAGAERGNMRCFEAMGTASAMISDAGVYPDGFANGQNFVEFSHPLGAEQAVDQLLANPDLAQRIASAGRALMTNRYSRANQWHRFIELLSNA